MEKRRDLLNLKWKRINRMGGGIRNCCGKCGAIRDYDSKLQRCNKCGWTPHEDQTKLFNKKSKEEKKK